MLKVNNSLTGLACASQPELQPKSSARVLTAGVLGAMGSILELLEGGVGGDGVGHVLRPLWLEVVVSEAACEGRGKTSAGIDSKDGGKRATYLRLWSVELVLRASLRRCAPSLPMRFPDTFRLRRLT